VTLQVWVRDSVSSRSLNNEMGVYVEHDTIKWDYKRISLNVKRERAVEFWWVQNYMSAKYTLIDNRQLRDDLIAITQWTIDIYILNWKLTVRRNCTLLSTRFYQSSVRSINFISHRVFDERCVNDSCINRWMISGQDIIFDDQRQLPFGQTASLHRRASSLVWAYSQYSSASFSFQF